jgi:pyruvate dehydrogenase E1 component
MPRRYFSLGTEGFGRSDTRTALRRHFEIDAGHIVLAVLSQLSAEGSVEKTVLADAIARYEIKGDLPDPWSPLAH